MPLADKVLGGALVVTGTWAAWKHLTKLLIDNVKRELPKGARANEWQFLAASAALAINGVVWWINWVNKGPTRWLFTVAGIAILIWMLISDLASWRRNRAKREPDGPSTSAP